MNISTHQKIKKNHKIKLTKEFCAIFINGTLIRGKYYTLRYLKNDLSYDRMGIVVKKYIGNAVKRNYEKRILREFFRYHEYTGNLGYDFSILVKNSQGKFVDKKIEYTYLINKIHQNDSQ